MREPRGGALKAGRRTCKSFLSWGWDAVEQDDGLVRRPVDRRPDQRDRRGGLGWRAEGSRSGRRSRCAPSFLAAGTAAAVRRSVVLLEADGAHVAVDEAALHATLALVVLETPAQLDVVVLARPLRHVGLARRRRAGAAGLARHRRAGAAGGARPPRPGTVGLPAVTLTAALAAPSSDAGAGARAEPRAALRAATRPQGTAGADVRAQRGALTARAVIVQVLAPPPRVVRDGPNHGLERVAGAHAQGKPPGGRPVQAAEAGQFRGVAANKPAERVDPRVGHIVRLGVAGPHVRPLDGVEAVHAGPRRLRVPLLVDDGQFGGAPAAGETERLGLLPACR
eukprot:14253278-Heterocapsa_arctica.AAC.2